MKKVLTLVLTVLILFGWYVTLFGVGSIAPLKDQMKLGIDLKGGVYVVMEAQTDLEGADLKELMNQTQAVIEQRVNEMGLSEPVVTIEGNDRIRVELPGADNSNEAIETIGQTAQLQFLTADGNLVIDGSNVKDAGISQDSENGGYCVNLKFDSEGATKFEAATRAIVNGEISSSVEGLSGNAIVIMLDGKVISSPTVSKVISSNECEITGGGSGFQDDEASELAALIRGGSLPVELEEVETNIQGPTLGIDAVANSVKGGVIGFILLFILMIIMYRVMGLAANIALLLYVLIEFWVIVLLNGVMTLPGIAGIILSIGMAVDANVIIFSRIKEEIANGKSVRVSIKSGFKRAMATVVDAQVTTIIASIVLYQLGTGQVKGFALTLMIGIIASVFTAVVVTQLYLNVISESKLLSHKKFLGIKEIQKEVE